MIIIEIKGGLGNQLFQLFAAIATSIQYDVKFKIIHRKNTWRKTTYFNNMLKFLKPHLITRIHEQINLHDSQQFHYNEIKLPQSSKNYILKGLYQSYKYFEKHYFEILNMTGLRSLQIDIKNEFIGLGFLQNPTISLHFRLGDYKKLKHNHPIVPIKYYADAIGHIIKKTKNNNWDVLYFCEKEDNGIVSSKIKDLKKFYPDLTFIKVNDSIVDWKQLLLMSCCNHNIIGNSTFSWWGAYLNENKDKIVCYPSRWFGPKLKHLDTKDMFPPNWELVESS